MFLIIIQDDSNNPKTKASLDFALTAASLDKEVALYFTDNGIDNLINNPIIKSLELYEINKLYINPNNKKNINNLNLNLIQSNNFPDDYIILNFYTEYSQDQADKIIQQIKIFNYNTLLNYINNHEFK